MMVTYLYWITVALLACGAFYLLGARLDKWQAGMITSGLIIFIGFLLYFFWLEQIFVKRFGGQMSVHVPKGQYHMAATWKDDNLWVENYDPETNTCIFSEYSRGNMLEGRVFIKDCNPLRFQNPAKVGK